MEQADGMLRAYRRRHGHRPYYESSGQAADAARQHHAHRMGLEHQLEERCEALKRVLQLQPAAPGAVLRGLGALVGLEAEYRKATDALRYADDEYARWRAVEQEVGE